MYSHFNGWASACLTFPHFLLAVLFLCLRLALLQLCSITTCLSFSQFHDLELRVLRANISLTEYFPSRVGAGFLTRHLPRSRHVQLRAAGTLLIMTPSRRGRPFKRAPT
ncbi:hypothetical protein C8Q79DRAFT_724661 [Trametes meyenii]|nr:hypothetical protein C8Q79DRAFT_724661 [Trametes meyenii]